MPLQREYKKSTRMLQPIAIKINLTSSICFRYYCIMYYFLSFAYNEVLPSQINLFALSVYWVSITSFLLLFPERYINLFFTHLLMLFLHLASTFFLITILLLYPLGIYYPQLCGAFGNTDPTFFMAYISFLSKYCSNQLLILSLPSLQRRQYISIDLFSQKHILNVSCVLAFCK